MIPVANFNFIPNGLSINFLDSSSGVPTSWNWNFLDSNGSNVGTSSAQNPSKTFSAAGKYTIVLISTNASGPSLPFSFDIVVESTPTLSLTIAEMVAYDTPAPLATNTPQFRNLIQKWQLFIQPFITPTAIADADVFNEAKWPPIANVLISKLVAYDMIISASTGAMTAYYAAQSLLSGTNPTKSGFVSVADYDAPLSNSLNPNFGAGDTVAINGIVINGFTSVSSGNMTSWLALQNWLNGLGFGAFIMQLVSGVPHIISKANNNILTTASLNYVISSISTGYNANFAATNAQELPITQSVTVVNAANTNLLMGSIKEMDTGPSKSQWYDSSNFWRVMFEKGRDGKDGIFETFKYEICALASRIGVHLPICPKFKPANLPQFLNTRNMAPSPNSPGYCGPNSWPAQNGGYWNPWYWGYYDCLVAFYPLMMETIFTL